MSSVVMTEIYRDNKRAEYINFVERLGMAVRFSEDKWVCDKLRRSSAETARDFTLHFTKTPEQYREIVKYFSALRIINGTTIGTVMIDVCNFNKFLRFWVLNYRGVGLHMCDESVASMFYQYLEESALKEGTRGRVWTAASTFFRVMNGWDNIPLRNPFSSWPYNPQRKFDDMYIPNNVASQLDNIFKRDEIDLHLRCAYWILRLIPSRISEIVGIRIDCLKRYDGHYVLFIPTWKQNGGRLEPIMRSIHLEETGIAGYLIDLIKNQQEFARKLQIYMPEHKKDALFTYRRRFERKGQLPYYSNEYSVSTKTSIPQAFRKLCEKYSITDDNCRIYELTTHQFRHNGITDRLASGFTAAQIADMTGHHGNAMIFESYAHLNLLPETIIEKQENVIQEEGNREHRYVMFGGRILNMDEKLENHLLRNLRAHKVRGGICSDITGCKSDMWSCLDCALFVPDFSQMDYYKEQIRLWREKSIKFSDFPVIKGNAEKNAELYEAVLKKLKGEKNA
jgi:integrase